MELGEKLKRARLEAGLSQRQLCGEEITRNMLSQIENGTASPSMNTLRFLAGRLGKTVSYFLEEEAVVSQNQELMEMLRRAFDEQNWNQVWDLLKRYQKPDPVFDREQELIHSITMLHLAEKALAEGRGRLAKDFLEQGISAVYLSEVLEDRRQLLLGRLPGIDPREIRLPGIDEQLLLRASAALADANAARAGALLDAVENQSSPRWNLLRGKSHQALGKFREAISCYQCAEAAFSEEAWAGLEACYSQLRDFENAYLYACKRR